MNHLEFAAAESDALEPTAWDAWIEEAERLAKGHDIGREDAAASACIGSRLDGDQGEDGFSLDDAYDAFVEGATPTGYILLVQHRIKDCATAPFIDYATYVGDLMGG